MHTELAVAPLVGVRVVAVFLNGSCTWFHLRGRVAGDRLVLLEPREGLDPSEAALVGLYTRAAVGQNMMATAELVGRRGNAWMARVTREWRPADARRYPRFRLEVGAWVRDGCSGPQIAGRLIDISAGGAAIETAARPGSSTVFATILHESFAGTLPARVVSITPGDEGRHVLHLEFGSNLEAYQCAFIRTLVEKAAEANGWIRGG